MTKSVSSDAAADHTKKFSFTIQLSDTEINKTYDGVEFTGGAATIELADTESITITGLPTGVTYTVTETAESAEGFTTTYTGETGTISKTASTAAFTNTRKLSGLTVTKAVEGNMGDRDKNFSFTVTLDDTTINGKYGGIEFTNGVAEFTLHHDQSVKISDLPSSIGVTITEAKTDASSYMTKVKKVAGEETEVLVNFPTVAEDEEYSSTEAVTCTFTLPEDDTEVTYTNVWDIPVPTGVNVDEVPYTVMLALSLALLAVMALRRRKEREE